VGRQLSKLSAFTVQRLKAKGRYADGGGLYLQITESGSKSWLFRFMLNNKSREMGLGPLELVSLAEAREKAHACRKLLLDGIDPIEERQITATKQRLNEAKRISFDECAKGFIDFKSAEWTNDKHRAQWSSTLAVYELDGMSHSLSDKFTFINSR